MNYPKQKIAEELASYGRYGDEKLLHVNEAELRGLASLSPKGLTTNPVTGQPEAFNFMETLLPILATIAGTAVGGPMGGALASGAATTALTGDLKRGLLSGIMSYGMGSALSKVGSVAEGAASEASALTSLAETGLPAESIMPGIADTGSSFMEEVALQNLVQPGAIGVEGTGIGLTAQSTLTPPPPLPSFGEKVKGMFSDPSMLLEEVRQPKNILPIALGGGQYAEMDARDVWEKQVAELQRKNDEDKGKYYDDLQRGYAAAQPFAQRGLSSYRRQMSVNTPPPWQPSGYAGGGVVHMPDGGRAPYYDEDGEFARNYGQYNDYNSGYGGIDPVTIQRNLRGQSVTPPPGYIAGFNPEFSYFQNLAEGQIPQVPQFNAPFQNNLYAGSPINRFQQNPDAPYFKNILPPHKGGETRVPKPTPYADGGDVQLNTSLGPVSVAGGGIASMLGEVIGQTAPDQQDIALLGMAINGQLEAQQVDVVINMFIEKYGVEAFRAVREQIMGATQNEGIIQGAGDGMADQVQGMIGNQQPVAVSPGEFIVPADVVSGLGNGSSDAGAQQLDQMMGNVRQARHGGSVQPPPIDPRKMMPA